MWQVAHAPGVTPRCTDPRTLGVVPAVPGGVAAFDAAVDGVAAVVAVVGPVPRRAGKVAVAFADFTALRLPPSNEVVL